MGGGDALEFVAAFSTEHDPAAGVLTYDKGPSEVVHVAEQVERVLSKYVGEKDEKRLDE